MHFRTYVQNSNYRFFGILLDTVLLSYSLKGNTMIYGEKERRDDFHWFLKNYDSLYSQYGHKFFAIQNQKILGVYDGMWDALDETSKISPIGTFCVQECTGDESGYTVSIVAPWIIA